MSRSANPSAELCAYESHDRLLRVRFTWNKDRYGHAIDLIEGNRTRPLLESVEGTDQEFWPPSPPLQTINISRIASDSENRQVAMMSGGAGTSLWSMCVAVCDSLNTPRRGEEFFDTEIIFDVACRLQKSPAWLGSTYRALAAPIAVSESLNSACIPVTPPRCVMVTHQVQLQMETNSGPFPLLRCRAKEGDIATIEPPETVRWRYTLRFVGWKRADFDRTILRSAGH